MKKLLLVLMTVALLGIVGCRKILEAECVVDSVVTDVNIVQTGQMTFGGEKYVIQQVRFESGGMLTLRRLESEMEPVGKGVKVRVYRYGDGYRFEYPDAEKGQSRKRN